MIHLILLYQRLDPKATSNFYPDRAFTPLPTASKKIGIPKPQCLVFRSSGIDLQGRVLNALEAAAEVVGKGSSIWSGTDLMLQSGQSAVQLRAGNVIGYWSGDMFRAMQPPRPEAGCLALVPGEELRVRVAARGSQRPVKLLASCNGAYLIDRQAS